MDSQTPVCTHVHRLARPMNIINTVPNTKPRGAKAIGQARRPVPIMSPSIFRNCCVRRISTILWWLNGGRTTAGRPGQLSSHKRSARLDIQFEKKCYLPARTHPPPPRCPPHNPMLDYARHHSSRKDALGRQAGAYVHQAGQTCPYMSLA